MNITAYEAPPSLEEALQMLQRWGRRAVVLAGGTDLVLKLRAGGGSDPALLLNVKRLPGLDAIRETEDGLELGALVTVTLLLESALVREHLPALQAAADGFASAQIRNGATVGGNLVNASPAADLVIPLLIHDARVRLARLQDERVLWRELPLADFFTGPGTTRRQPEELLTAVVVPRPERTFRGRFTKAGTRPALDIAIVSVGVGYRLDEQGRVRGARVALGAVAPTPLRAVAAEEVLEGAWPDAEVASRAAAAAVDQSRPIDDVRASVWYRRHLLRVLVEREIRRVGVG